MPKSHTTPLFDYYQIPFRDLNEAVTSRLTDICRIELRSMRSQHWMRYAGKEFQEEDAWNILYEYALNIERQLKSILQTHTLFYWIHLYRRIGVDVYSDNGNRIDPHTIALVRQIVEAAIIRFGVFTEQSEDVQLATNISAQEVLGGLFVQSMNKHFTKSKADILVNALLKSDQWVLTRFSAYDYIDIYRIENLCHEYWLVTARMRAVGKGGEISVSNTGIPGSKRTDDLEWLIHSFDLRIENHPFNTSRIGVSFDSINPSGDLNAIVASYNITKKPFKEICASHLRESIPSDDPCNFIIGHFELASYLAAHSFIESDFIRSHGFSLTGLCAVISAAGNIEAFFAMKSNEGIIAALWNLHQRAYSIRPGKSYFSTLKSTAIYIARKVLKCDPQQIEMEFDAILEFLTLKESKQSQIGLWSGGPRYLFIPYGSKVLVDLQGILMILHNIFFKVKHEQSRKGPLFEDDFRRTLSNEGFELFDVRLLKSNGVVREVDAAIRIGSSLILCECRTIELPLDYERGRIKTIRTRCELLKEKIDQVDSLMEFCRQNPKGHNYDFSWATQISGIVVSPFVQWIWTRDSTLWDDKGVPRILAMHEAIVWLHQLKKG